jgi:protein-S-isoprenylcysteine O-methyltransferase Ste14
MLMLCKFIYAVRPSAAGACLWESSCLHAHFGQRKTLLKLNIGTLALLIAFALVFGKYAWDLPWTLPRIVGLSIAVPSLVLLAVARIQLGRAFSVKAKATTLVTTGLYSRIRNPIYLFSGLVIAGFIIWTNELWFFVIFVFLIPLQVYRSRKEAQVLEEKFGAAYLDYRRKTWF